MLVFLLSHYSLLQFGILTEISNRIEPLLLRRSDFFVPIKKVKTIGSQTTLNYLNTINSVSFTCIKKCTHHINQFNKKGPLLKTLQPFANCKSLQCTIDVELHIGASLPLSQLWIWQTCDPFKWWNYLNRN